MTDYTPGPWNVDFSEDNWAHVYTEDDSVCHLQFGYVEESDKSRILANAELIASAPRLKQDRDELLEHLKAFVARYPNNIGAWHARELIAKVEK